MSESFDPSELLGSDVPFDDPFSFDERHFLPAFWEPALRQALTQTQPVCPQTIKSQPKQPKQLRHDAHAPGLLSPDHAPACRSPTYAELSNVGMRMPTHPVCTSVPQPRAELLNLEIETSSSDAALTVHAEVQPNCRSRIRMPTHPVCTRVPLPRAELLNLEIETSSSDAALTVHAEVQPNCCSRMRMPTHPVCTRVPQPRAELLNLEIETSSSDAAMTVHAEVQPNCRSCKRTAEHAMKATFASDSEHDALSSDFEGQAGAAAGTVANEGTGAGEGKYTYDVARTNLHHRPSPRVRCTRTCLTHVWGLNAIHCWQNASIFWMPRSWLQHQWLVWQQ